jgi:hypothetical protein
MGTPLWLYQSKIPARMQTAADAGMLLLFLILDYDE